MVRLGFLMATVWGALLPLGAWGAKPGEEFDPRNVPNEQVLATLNQKSGDGEYAEALRLLDFTLFGPEHDSAPAPSAYWLQPAQGSQLGVLLANYTGVLQQLNRSSEIDAFLEKFIAVYSGSWRALEAAARRYYYEESFGRIVAGKFYRGNQQRNGDFASCAERDRVRAMQLMAQCVPLVEKDPDTVAAGWFYMNFARFIQQMRASQQMSWLLQDLTDLTALPDYDMQNPYGVRRHSGGNPRGAAVDAAGNPLYYAVPESWDAAENDGQRWRWCLERAVAKNRGVMLEGWDAGQAFECEALYARAEFCLSQFGVQTARIVFDQRDDTVIEKQKQQGGIFVLHTLKDTETIAQLASGIQRFTPPEEFNAVLLLQRLASTPNHRTRDALAHLGRIMMNRRQFPRAVGYLEQYLERIDAAATLPKVFLNGLTPLHGHNADWARDKIAQITGNWSRFEYQPQQTTEAPKLTVRYRNATRLKFRARPINLDLLYADMREMIEKAVKASPFPVNQQNKVWDHNLAQIEGIAGSLIQGQREKYLIQEPTDWTVDVAPPEGHFDATLEIDFPVRKPGAYYVEQEAENGNRTVAMLWLTDTIIVRKAVDRAQWYYVADSATGKPIPGATIEAVGYRQEWLEGSDRRNRNPKYKFTSHFTTATTDANGQWLASSEALPPEYQYFIAVKLPGQSSLAAFLGFNWNHIWYPQLYDYRYDELKAFPITDRPVYRPDQTVHFKFWLATAKYERDGDAWAQEQNRKKSRHADKPLLVEVYDPNGEKVAEFKLTTDDFGGVDGKLVLGKDAKLGQYSVQVMDPSRNHYYGDTTFRLEEYKKPEFEVTVDAPTAPVMLGERVQATVTAKYYFGAPVTSGTVKFKVERVAYDQQWYAPARWDWLYGPGYWWAVSDLHWYPGWARWGCCGPLPPWFGRGHEAPELVMEEEVKLTPEMNGKATVNIDTSLALALFGDRDHKYTVSAEVVDESRRVITGSGDVLVARQPFRVHTWTDRGYYRVGQQITAHFAARTLAGKPVTGTGVLRVFEVTYDAAGKPLEKEIQTEELAVNPAGQLDFALKATHAGQFRIAYTLTSAGENPRSIEGAQLITVSGKNFDGDGLRFCDLELIPDKAEYRPGETVKLMVNTNRPDAQVALFLRATDGVGYPPIFLQMDGKSRLVEVPIERKDQPNFFIEAVTVANAQVYSQCREICVPPEERILNMELTPNKARYSPGEDATAKIRLTDEHGRPFVGTMVVTVYDKSVEYISGGSNVPNIYTFFWSWRRNHSPQSSANTHLGGGNMVPPNATYMANLGVFGELALIGALGYDKDGEVFRQKGVRMMAGGSLGSARKSRATFARNESMRSDSDVKEELSEVAMEATAMALPAPAEAPASDMMADAIEYDLGDGNSEKKLNRDNGKPDDTGTLVETTVRSNFADTAFWCATLTTDSEGYAEVAFPMPENLTTWKICAWAYGMGSRVGKAQAEVITAKNLIIRMQTPRFLTTSDEALFTANVHNYLETEKRVQVKIALPEGAPVALLDDPARTVSIPAQGEARVDWRVRAQSEGACEVAMSALTNEESDAMKLTLPVQIHGMLKQEARSGMVPGDALEGTADATGVMTFTIPEARRPADSHLEIRFSPTLAGAMLDALPYLADYPYGCTEQTLNRFLPAVLTQKTLVALGVDLAQIRDKRANLNAQEMGDAKERAGQWKLAQRRDFEPVFDEAALSDRVESGVERLVNMQCSDGGWGWFSGYGEHSTPHLTAYVTRGLLLARQNEVQVPQDTLDRGVAWLQHYQSEQVLLLKNGEKVAREGGQFKHVPGFRYKSQADDMDAMVFYALAQTGNMGIQDMAEMERFLIRDRVKLSYQSNAMLAIALFQRENMETVAVILKYLGQYVKVDEENQTAYLSLPQSYRWWYWYGNDIETQAAFLRLLAMTGDRFQPCVREYSNLELAARCVKYLLNNRKNAVYWSSTRDTALVLEAMTAYLRTTNELAPRMTVEVALDGEVHKTVEITPENLFTIDNAFILDGEAVTGGNHTVELRRAGSGPLYFNGYASFFTLEDFITKAGLEVKVDRKYYRLNRVEATQNAAGTRGQLVKQNVVKYEREPLETGAVVKSGDLIEVELTIDSKNDYTYLMFEDMKPAGFEPVDVRSGYNGNSMGAYVEYRDNRVVFFVQTLSQGLHSVSYRMRAETPGSVSALPTRCEAMYAPELRANSDEMKIRCED